MLALSLLAQPAPPRAAQHELFAPPTPQPEPLEITLARLAALVGPDRLGSPVLADSHQPDAFSLARFAAPHGAAHLERGQGPEPARLGDGALALRHYRPPLPALVSLAGGRPTRVEAPGIQGAVVVAAGPWTREGAWWSPHSWWRDDWDVALSDKVLYRIFREHPRRRWFVEGYYD